MRAGGGRDGDREVGLRAGNTLLHLLEAAVLETKNRMDAGVAMLREQDRGEIASVVHHDVVGCQHGQVLQGALSLVALRDEIEIPGQL